MPPRTPCVGAALRQSVFLIVTQKAKKINPYQKTASAVLRPALKYVILFIINYYGSIWKGKGVKAIMRFLHTGDLHLGSAFAGFSPRVAAAWRAQQLVAVEALLDEAVARGAELLLFAGDVFDTATPDMALVRSFFALLARTGLPAVIAPGNHDPYRKGGFYDTCDLPPNVHLFREEEVACFSFPSIGVSVFGYAFCSDTHTAPLLPTKEMLSPGAVNILLAHTALLSPHTPYAPISAEQLTRAGFDYAALGHVHLPEAPRRFGDTLAAYCGFFAGRGFDEPCAGHANFVEIVGSQIEIVPIESTANRFYLLEVDCTGAADAVEVRERLAAALQVAAYPADAAVRALLVGEVGPDCVPVLRVLSRLGADFALFEVRDETLPLFDVARLESEPTLRGAFYRAMKSRLESPDAKERALAAAALRMGFAALSGREV